MSKYALACPHCDQVTEVAVTQAGQEIECNACHETINAPRLGELKQLPVIDNAPGKADTRKSRRKNHSNSGLFVAGLLLAILGLGGGGSLFAYGNSLISDFDLERNLDLIDQEIDELEGHFVVLYYESLPIEKGLGEWYEQSYVGQTRQGKILRNISYGLMAVGLVGLVLMLLGIRRN